ncbi:unnamed protein product [Caretta caretta]
MLLPLIKPHGRVVNVSSFISVRTLKRCSQDLQQKFHSDTITEEELVKLMTKFVEDTKNGVHEKEGWPNTAYETEGLPPRPGPAPDTDTDTDKSLGRGSSSVRARPEPPPPRQFAR